jgi:hypothetical protein
MKTIILPLLVIFVSVLAACGSSEESNYDKKFQQSELNRNKVLWQNSSFATYQYTYRASCNCLLTQSVTVYINSGEISEAYFLDSGSNLNAAEIKQILTIEQLFAAVQQAIDKNAYNLITTYHTEKGFPETVTIDFNKDIADDEISYYIKDLE